MALSKLPLRVFGAAGIVAATGGAAPPQQTPADDFVQSIRPVLTRNYASCHTARSRINFLKAWAANWMPQRGAGSHFGAA